MVKGDNKYPRTKASTLHFLQYHSLRNSNPDSETYRGKRSDLALAQDTIDEEEKGEKGKPKGEPNMVSKRYGKYKDEKCSYKVDHTWKECPTIKWGMNKYKTVSDDGEILMCTMTEMMRAIYDDDDPVLCMGFSDDDDVDMDDGDEDIDSKLVN